MKKSLIIVLLVALLVAPLAAAPTKDEVASTLEGVMVVFAATLMGSMFGMELEGAVGEVDMETGNSVLTFDKMEAAAVFSGESAMGSMMAAGGEEIPELVFTEISGTVTVDEEGDMEGDVTLKGGPVKKLVMKTRGEDLLSLVADGKDFSYLADDPDFILMED